MLTPEQRRKADEKRRRQGRPPLTDYETNNSSPSDFTDSLGALLGGSDSGSYGGGSDSGSCDSGGGGGGDCS